MRLHSRRLFALAFAAAAGATLGATMSVELIGGWIGELLANLRLHLAAASGALALLAWLLPLVWWRRAGGALLMAALAALQGAPLAPYIAQSPPPTLQAAPDGSSLGVLVANLHSWAVDIGALDRLLRQSAADIVVLTEITPTQQPVYAALLERYPHQFQTPPGQDNTFTLRLLSRWPMDVALLDPLGPDHPVVRARLCVGEGRCFVLLTGHPPRPGPLRGVRNALLAALTQQAALEMQRSERVIVAGDLNITPFSPDFAPLAAAGLLDTALGRGYRATWPLSAGPLGIPIDQVLVSPGIGVAQRSLGPDIGSDHRPLFVELKLPR